MQIIEKRLNSLEQIFEALISYDDGWVFRGQSNASWGISRSIERVQQVGFNDNVLRKHEAYTRLKFENVAHHYLESQTLPKTDLSWLALMQHHGVPTRLVDFTTMPFVGLFFAISGIRLDEIQEHGACAIWCIPYRQMNDRSIEILKSRKPVAREDFHEELDVRSDEFFNTYIDKECHNLFWITEPRNLNLRLRQQGGTFLIADSLNKPLMELIENDSLYSSEIHKIIFPHSLITEIYSGLNKMHINHEQIYPGLDSVSRDIAIELLYLILMTPKGN